MIGEKLIGDRIPLISATGCTRMGQRIGAVVGERLGRTILELGGNNALIVSEKADLTGALASAFFGAVGTAGQRCTSTRRLIIHASVYDTFLKKLVANYKRVSIGDPLDPATLMGPLIDEGAVADYEAAIKAAKEQGGRIVYGGKVLSPPFGAAHFRAADDHRDRQQGGRSSSPRRSRRSLYVMKYEKLDQAIDLHNGVPQGLSSAIFTDSVGEAETFTELPGLRLRHRQREHRHLGRGDRRRVRRREGDRRRPRVGLRRLEGLHAPADEHHQLGRRGPPGPGGRVPSLATGYKILGPWVARFPRGRHIFRGTIKKYPIITGKCAIILISCGLVGGVCQHPLASAT